VAPFFSLVLRYFSWHWFCVILLGRAFFPFFFLPRVSYCVPRSLFFFLPWLFSFFFFLDFVLFLVLKLCAAVAVAAAAALRIVAPWCRGSC
jgi:hypothetical protein